MASINGENTDTNGLERTKTECSSGESLGNPWSSSRTCFKENESFLFDAETRRTQRAQRTTLIDSHLCTVFSERELRR